MEEINLQDKIKWINDLEGKLKNIYEKLYPKGQLKNYFAPEKQEGNKVENMPDLMYKMMFHAQNGTGKKE